MITLLKNISLDSAMEDPDAVYADSALCSNKNIDLRSLTSKVVIIPEIVLQVLRRTIMGRVEQLH